MPAAPAHPDDALRAELLHVLGLLDTAGQAAFDRITRVAAEVAGTPMALVSLLDTERQVFKARVGVTLADTPRDAAFCGHAIHGRDMLVVPDAAADARFADNPLVRGDPHIRFYAGLPVHTTGGVALGTLCVIDRQPRVLSDAQRAVLHDLAAMVEEEIARAEHAASMRQLSELTLSHARDSEQRFRATFEQAAVGIAMVDLDGRWLRVNGRLAAIVGYEPAELARMTFQDITHPDDMQADLSLVQQLLAGQAQHYQLEKRYLRRDGSVVWINLTVSLVRDAAGAPDYFISVVEDIDARKRAEASLYALRQDLERRVAERTHELQLTNDMLSVAIRRRESTEAALRASEAELRAVLEHANDAYISIDEGGVVIEWNRQAETLFDWTREEAVGRRLDDLIVPAAHRDGHRHGIARFLATGQSRVMNRRTEVTASTRHGRLLPIELTLHMLQTERGKVFCAFLHDISERKALQQELESQAREDELTGLPNRRAFLAQLQRALAQADRSGTPLAVLFVDLDGFKAINDAWGHEAGDQVLRQFAHRLRQSVRQTDLVARLAGDEFVVLAPLTGGYAPDASRLVSKLEAAGALPFAVDGRSLQAGASVGLQVYTPGCGQQAADVLAQADQAMYASKRERRARREAVNVTI